MTPDEQLGYDTWIDVWVSTGTTPRVLDCPARYVKDDDRRYAIIKGWNTARNEFNADV